MEEKKKNILTGKKKRKHSYKERRRKTYLTLIGLLMEGVSPTRVVFCRTPTGACYARRVTQQYPEAEPWLFVA
jgi:hypothetical protein